MTNNTHPTAIVAPDGLPFVDTSRDFDAPIAAVYRAYTDVELAKQWIGPHGYEMEVLDWDLTTGGRYSYVHRDPSKPGEEYEFRGVIHEAVPDDHLTQTFEFAGAPGHVSLETATFTDLGDGHTRVTGHSVFGSVADRDAIVASGMKRGITEGFERLDTLLGAEA